MAQVDSDTFAKDNLADFKNRMRIFTTADDSNLTIMLKTSAIAICDLVGTDTITDRVKELIFERARYVYCDALDEFMTNYGNEIHNLFVTLQVENGGNLYD